MEQHSWFKSFNDTEAGFRRALVTWYFINFEQMNIWWVSFCSCFEKLIFALDVFSWKVQPRRISGFVLFKRKNKKTNTFCALKLLHVFLMRKDYALQLHTGNVWKKLRINFQCQRRFWSIFFKLEKTSGIKWMTIILDLTWINKLGVDSVNHVF